MGKFDAQERQSQGKPVPEDIQRMLSALVATSTASGDIVDIYEAAGLPKPSLSDLGPDFVVKAQAASNPQLAIEALRALLLEESEKVTRHNLVRQRAFSERLKELMRKYTNQLLTSAEVIAELIELAKEVTAERNRGLGFSPPLSEDELAFYDGLYRVHGPEPQCLESLDREICESRGVLDVEADSIGIRAFPEREIGVPRIARCEPTKLAQPLV